MPHRQVPAARTAPLAWARLNADTLFIGLLALGSGLFSLFDPYADPILASRRVVDNPFATYPLFYVLAGALGLSGLILIIALARASVPLEVVARSVLIGACALNVFRTQTFLPWNDPDALRALVLLFMILSTTVLRLSVLLGDKAVVISRPRRAREEDR